MARSSPPPGLGRKPRVPVGPGNESAPISFRPPPSRVPRIVAWILLAVIGLPLVGACGIAGVFWYYGRDLPNVADLRTRWRPPQTTRILARDGSVLAELYLERRTVVPMDAIPRNLVMAVLAAEDADFYRHQGLDYFGMIRALAVDIRRGTTAQGASTITQQVVKNIVLSPERTLARKVREVLLARDIEQHLQKNEILHLYLNHIAFGHGRNGVEEASRYYFGHSVSDLTLGEAALLAGVPKSPTHYSPRNDPQAALRRRRWILGQMVRNGFVQAAEADVAAEEPLHLAEPRDDAQGIAPEVVEAARTLLRGAAGEAALRSGGYTIWTTIDPQLERAARDALRTGLRDLDTRQGYLGPLLAPTERRIRGRPGYVLPGEPPPQDGRLLPGHVYGGVVESVTVGAAADGSQDVINVRVGEVVGRVAWAAMGRYVRGDVRAQAFAPVGSLLRVSVDRAAASGVPCDMSPELGPQGALVAVDPTSRDVLAVVGGYEAIAGMFDRATRAHRQAGSSFKPFLYALAFASHRYTPGSTVDSTPGCFDRWCPSESHAPAPGAPPEPPMRLREALAASRNMVAARLVMDLGPQALAEHAQQYGLESRLAPVPALALGAADVTPLEMTNAFATWAAQGMWQPPRLVTRIVAPDGRELPLPERASPRRVVDPQTAWLVTSVLTSVVDHGTGQRARALRRPVAGKTGTSNEARDAWFVGYTTDVAVGVWVGFDDRQPLGRGEEGARSAVPVWTQFVRAMSSIRRGPVIDFPRPDGIVSVRIDPVTGLRAPDGWPGAIEEHFLAGTEPTTYVSAPDAGVPLADAAPLVAPDASPVPAAPAADAAIVGSVDVASPTVTP